MLKYWVWLSTCLDNSSTHLKPLLDKYKTPLAVYKTSISELENSYLVSPNELKRLNNKTLDKSDRIIVECEESKIDIIAFDDPRYPLSLKEIPNPPACLYVKGKLKDLSDLPIVCIVGSRKATDYGIKSAWSLAARLAGGGIAVLSGGALGIDAAAHEGALAVGGKTIAVLPCGINYGYLKTNEFLRKTITDGGCLISEFPPDTPLYKNAFQIRNRLLSGISLGVVVIEASEGSGTLITARYALEQGRDVFVVTGRPTDENHGGSNALLRDGAIPVFSAEDIFKEYEHLFPNVIDCKRAMENDIIRLYRAFNSPKLFSDTQGFGAESVQSEENNKKIKKNIDETLPKNVKMVYNYIDTDLFTVDDLMTVGLSFEEILAAITQLELYGYIKAVPGGRYSIIF
jgi:DNA processing protein